VFGQAVRARQIARGHLAADARCIARCLVFDLRPVFIHRNIFEALLSFADHYREKYHPYPVEAPDAGTALEISILRMAYHYVEMFASWTHFARRSGRVLTLSYEENRRDWPQAAARALEHSGYAVDRARLEEAVTASEAAIKRDPHSVRYSTGGKRDATMIDPETVERVRRVYRAFPGVDFSPIDPFIDQEADAQR
jgi:hypothetical protein